MEAEVGGHPFVYSSLRLLPSYVSSLREPLHHIRNWLLKQYFWTKSIESFQNPVIFAGRLEFIIHPKI
jgi:hypothetical protein